jgi:diguanylate cyclase (GGDEF)-like protein/PAS domain S-box-containing protein
MTGKELRILILEDVVTDAELMEHELRKAGITFASRCVQTKEAFIKELENFTPNLILADYSLPQFDSISALVIAKEQCPDAPFIIVSGLIGEELAVEAIKSGATDYVSKQRLFRLGPSVRRALREAEERAELKQAEEALRESEEKYRTLFETAKDAIFVSDEAGRFIDVNTAACESLGYSKEELLRLGNKELDADLESYKAFLKVRNGQVKKITFEVNQLKKDGTILPVEITGSFFESQGLKMALAIARDTTERKRAEEVLRESEEKYRSLVESTEDSIFLLDRNYRYLFMNKKHLSRMQLSSASYLGCAYSELHSSDETKEFIEKAARVFETCESVQMEYRSPGDGKYFLRTLSPIKGPDGNTIAITVVSKDITELKQMEEKLRVLSLTDELTGLYNRRGFLTLSEQQLKMANRLKSEIFMLYADQDNLKEINDRFGHQEGDLALIEVADIFKTTYRASDIIARIGGDEFAIFSVGTTRAYAEIMTDRLQKNLDIHNAKADRNYKLSISVGITYCDPECPYSIDDLLIQAEKLMYEQKRTKRRKNSNLI